MIKVELTSDNLHDCVALFLSAYNSAPWNCQWTTEKATLYLDELRGNSNSAGFILYENETAVGAILGHRKTWWTNRQFMIDEFFISPDFQRKGYGKKLMQLCEEYVALHDIDLMVLMTNKYLPAYQFYERYGYVPADQYTFMFKQKI